jgi:hypothetical protein
MKYLLILLLLPVYVAADEFEWNSSSTHVSEIRLSTESGDVLVVVGSHCDEGDSFCDIAAKFSNSKNSDVEFLREMTNGKADASPMENGIVISLIYYPFRWEEGQKVNRYYEWNKVSKTIELKKSTKQKLKI